MNEIYQRKIIIKTNSIQRNLRVKSQKIWIYKLICDETKKRLGIFLEYKKIFK
jgi:hypothetical protein